MGFYNNAYQAPHPGFGNKPATLNKFDAFKVAHPAEADWLIDNAPKSGFAASLLQFVSRTGYLSEKQLACVTNNLAKEAAKVAQAAVAPVVPMASKLDEAFAYAKAQGKVRLKLNTGEFTFKPAKKYPGVTYVTASKGGEYLGKIAGGKLLTVAAGAGSAEAILAAAADPFKAATVYGQQTGTCCICGAMLTNAESISLGIGPICRQSWGW